MKRSTSLQRHTPLKRSSGLRRTGSLKSRRRRETPAEKAAREHFAFEVCFERKCFFFDITEAGEPRRPGHVCSDGPLDPHHLIRKSWIQDHFGDLPEDELLAIKYAVVIGCPLCRDAHDKLPANLKEGDRVYFEELDDDLIDFAIWVDSRYRRPGRPSMLARLELECPPRPTSKPTSGVGAGGPVPQGPGSSEKVGGEGSR